MNNIGKLFVRNNTQKYLKLLGLIFFFPMCIVYKPILLDSYGKTIDHIFKFAP